MKRIVESYPEPIVPIDQIDFKNGLPYVAIYNKHTQSIWKLSCVNTLEYGFVNLKDNTTWIATYSRSAKDSIKLAMKETGNQIMIFDTFKEFLSWAHEV